jgi:2-polyprenyl-6-methoxyphenol hydroxylase-like FAD-dependent oxidoreductase
MTPSVLIAGAGPTGLTLALSLARRGVLPRVISQAEGPGEHSRAIVVQARTLEFYRQFGLADEVIDQGVIADAAHVREGGDDGEAHEVTSISFKDLGDNISPYPFALAYPQDAHERFLVGKLQETGCKVEWGSTLMGFSEEAEGIRAQVSRDGRLEEIRAQYLCGCDGAHSQVREALKIGFPGGTYEQLFYVADVRIARGFDRDLYINLGEHILTLMFPVRANGMQRLIGLVPPELSDRTDLTFENIRNKVERQLGVKVVEVNWFSIYRVHHRVSEKFRVGRAFLLGDAAHIHSPAGGQGMNTGIGDAVNLGWKLVHVLQERANLSLLDTYESERIGFARLLVATTDRAFTALVAEGLIGEVIRRVLTPLIFSVASRFTATRHAIFRVVSQTRIHYRESPLSQGQAGHIRGGDRLPWSGAGGEDNFGPLRSLDWQLHVYGETGKELAAAARQMRLPIHTFGWSEQAAQADFKRDAAYLVRPDGYVAVAMAQQSLESLRALVERFGIQFGKAPV